MKNKLISIKRIVEKETGLRIDTKDRRRETTYARAVYCKVAREVKDDKRRTSFRLVGEVINRDHASVMHNINVIFPFAVKEKMYEVLYRTLREMFVLDDQSTSYEEAVEVSERIIKLEKENDALRYKLQLISKEGDRFGTLTSGLSQEELDEIYDKINIMVKSIKTRVYR